MWLGDTDGTGVHGRLASLNRNAFFYQSEWGGGKEGEAGCELVDLLCSRNARPGKALVGRRAVGDQPAPIPRENWKLRRWGMRTIGMWSSHARSEGSLRPPFETKVKEWTRAVGDLPGCPAVGDE